MPHPPDAYATMKLESKHLLLVYLVMNPIATVVSSVSSLRVMELDWLTNVKYGVGDPHSWVICDLSQTPGPASTENVFIV